MKTEVSEAGIIPLRLAPREPIEPGRLTEPLSVGALFSGMENEGIRFRGAGPEAPGEITGAAHFRDLEIMNNHLTVIEEWHILDHHRHGWFWPAFLATIPCLKKWMGPRVVHLRPA